MIDSRQILLNLTNNLLNNASGNESGNMSNNASAATMDAFLSTSANEMTTKYETENNIKITNL